MKYKPLLERPRTFLIDIDGVIIEQSNKWDDGRIPDEHDFKELPSSRRTINRWKADGNKIVLTTARPEPYRFRTEHQLQRIGIMYDVLIMGLPNGQRILINDKKPQEDIDTAIAINLDRDVGLGGIEI